MGRIGRAGSSVMAARRRAARAGVEVSAPGMGILGVLERGGPQRVSAVARRAGMVGDAGRVASCACSKTPGYVARAPTAPTAGVVVVSITGKGRDAYRRLRAASVEAAARPWPAGRADELTELARLLGRMADDFGAARP